MSKARITYHLRVRRYPEEKFCSVWLVRCDGPIEASLLWGELLPQALEELIVALKLPIRTDVSPLEGLNPLQPVGCASLPRQKELFG